MVVRKSADWKVYYTIFIICRVIALWQNNLSTVRNIIPRLFGNPSFSICRVTCSDLWKVFYQKFCPGITPGLLKVLTWNSKRHRKINGNDKKKGVMTGKAAPVRVWPLLMALVYYSAEKKKKKNWFQTSIKIQTNPYPWGSFWGC